MSPDRVIFSSELMFPLQKEESEPTAPGKHLPNDKSAKAPEVLRYGGREMQVEALVKKLPQLRPRCLIPEKPVLSVHAPTPAFTANDSSGVQVTLPITVATLSSQQHGSTLPLMILPQSVAVSTATPVTAASKRASDSSTVAVGPPLKRKRGRPRKQRPEEMPAAQNLSPNQNLNLNPNLSLNPVMLNRGVIQKALSSSSSSSQVTETVLQRKAEEPEPQRVVFLQEPGRAMVIQRAPVSRETLQPCNQVQVTQSAAVHLPPPTVNEDRGVVEITLTPIEPLITTDDSVCSVSKTSPGEGEVP